MKSISFRSVALVSFLLLVFLGCSRAPALSGKGYQQALALLNTCQRKDEAALQRLQESLKKAIDSSEITAEEASVLSALVEKAKQGDWDAAASKVRKLLDKQASYSPPAATASSSGESRHQHSH
jgi:hypothetical protein